REGSPEPARTRPPPFSAWMTWLHSYQSERINRYRPLGGNQLSANRRRPTASPGRPAPAGNARGPAHAVHDGLTLAEMAPARYRRIRSRPLQGWSYRDLPSYGGGNDPADWGECLACRSSRRRGA